MKLTQEKKLGLRARQRAARRERIMFIAGELFMCQGYEETSLEEIAEKADLSSQTIYNYFESKRELLYLLHQRDEEQVADMMEARLPSLLALDDVVEPIIQLLYLPITSGYDYAKKRVWREIISLLMRSSPEYRLRYLGTLQRRRDMISAVLTRHQERGSIKNAVNCNLVADILQSIARNEFRAFILDDDKQIDTLRTEIADKAIMVIESIRTP